MEKSVVIHQGKNTKQNKHNSDDYVRSTKEFIVYPTLHKVSHCQIVTEQNGSHSKRNERSAYKNGLM